MLIVCPVPNAGSVHFLMYRSRATLRVGHLPVKRAMPAHSRSRSGVEDGRADEAHSPDDHEDDPHRGNPDPVTVRSYGPAHYGTRTDGDKAEDHSCQTHCLCLISVPWP